MQIAGRYRSEDGKRAGRGGWWLPILGLLIHLCPRGRKKGTAASIDSSCWPLGRQAEREAIAEKSHSVLLLSPFSLGCCGCYSLSLPRRMARFCTKKKRTSRTRRNGGGETVESSAAVSSAASTRASVFRRLSLIGRSERVDTEWGWALIDFVPFRFALDVCARNDVDSFLRGGS